MKCRYKKERIIKKNQKIVFLLNKCYWDKAASNVHNFKIKIVFIETSLHILFKMSVTGMKLHH